MHIEGGGSERQIAVSQDASEKGVLVATPTEVTEGAPVTITLRMPGSNRIEKTVQGVIVRVKQNPHDPDGPLGYHVAIEFDEEIPELKRALEELSGEG